MKYCRHGYSTDYDCEKCDIRAFRIGVGVYLAVVAALAIFAIVKWNP